MLLYKCFGIFMFMSNLVNGLLILGLCIGLDVEALSYRGLCFHSVTYLTCNYGTKICSLL